MTVYDSDAFGVPQLEPQNDAGKLSLHLYRIGS